MLVTDKKISMHPKLKSKLDLMIHRMEKKGFDNCLIMDGKEGLGKTTLATQCCYYVSYETGRKFNSDNIYFRVKNLLEVMQKTKSGIFLLDEAELDLLSEQRGKMQRYFMQMLMAARKKNHFIIAIIPSIKKLKGYVIERAIGFIRVYSPDHLTRGFYAYYKEDSKNALYERWKRSRKIEYKKYYTFNGTFSKKFTELIDEEKYDEKKDKAIASIGKEEKRDNNFKKLIKIQYLLWCAGNKKAFGLTGRKIAKITQYTERQVTEWKNYPENYGFLEGVEFDIGD